MSWISALGGGVSTFTQRLGQHSFERGEVRLWATEPGRLGATVQGRYRVQVLVEEDCLRTGCSCPMARAGARRTCEHVWAALYAAESVGWLEAGFEDPSEAARPSRPPRPPAWMQTLEIALAAETPDESWAPGRQLLYLIDPQSSLQIGTVSLGVQSRDRTLSGGWSRPKPFRPAERVLRALPDPRDRCLLALLEGAESKGDRFSYRPESEAEYALARPTLAELLRLACETGRCHLRTAEGEPEAAALQWDGAGPWDLWLVVRSDAARKELVLSGELRRNGEVLRLDAPVLLIGGGVVFTQERVAPLRDHGAFGWINLLRKQSPEVRVPASDRQKLIETLSRMALPFLDLPAELSLERVSVPPTPRLQVRSARWANDKLPTALSIEYAGVPVGRARGPVLIDPKGGRVLVRDPAAEQAARERLWDLGVRPRERGEGPRELHVSARHLPRVVRDLTAEGWSVEAEGKLYRRAGAMKLELRSGIDWFDLAGKVDFGGTEAELPALLAALKRGENLVPLKDGSFGVVPEDWLRRLGPLAGLGETQDGSLRFRRNQVGLLDALLASQPEARVDEAFARAREELRAFQGIEPADPPASFQGTLRPYQREGLGWLHFLLRFGFGGCLADDMGLGKTVQVLALLEALRAARGGGPAPGPTLLVVPRSLVFNWRAEAARFAPALRVLDHSRPDRARDGDAGLDGADVVLTTYGTLRRDILRLKDVRFHLVVLDEAQAIKNAGSESAKAVRLLQAEHRLALSGTPIENHQRELWSLFEFLNPGMLGSSTAFGTLLSGSARDPDPEARRLLASALRPFILRRTKEKVAPELPEKLEQTLWCELEPDHRRLYDELRDHYRRSLLPDVARNGIARSKFQVLEALLRLRQAACHPGLLDASRRGEAGAKLDALVPQVTEVMEEGHKVLVFSQFTSLLSILRERLDAEKIGYEYLDGQTRDRAARVTRFQEDPGRRLFLISLKAGGLGLNLTAAEYVFLLDPWWNPAVEAQAIDRAHRIGQTRRVFACRLIARNTVEEKVLELQGKKRALADAILNADQNLIRDLTREDLELLLS